MSVVPEVVTHYKNTSLHCLVTYVCDRVRASLTPYSQMFVKVSHLQLDLSLWHHTMSYSASKIDFILSFYCTARGQV
jgi:hypothetical protein